ncbi:MAG TPA: hypothetical protein VKN36_11860 [Eudoraea sp.]|nr:hypothetical protein [Eudoraea sp.]
MKNSLLVLFLMYNLTSCSQAYDIAGVYTAKYGLIQYQLTLHGDRTFIFNSYNKYNAGTPPEPSISGRGTWEAKKNMILFATDPEQDLDHTYRLIFNNSRAMLKRESPENQADDTVVNRLTFLESDIFWVKGIELVKKK